MKSAAKTRFGFTLIELLVVIAIIALLIAILFPALSGARNAAKFVRSQSNARSVSDLGQVLAHDDHPPCHQYVNGPGGANIKLPNRPAGIVHPMSCGGEVQWRGLGAWDWGGGKGTEPEYDKNGDFAPTARPLTNENSGVGLSTTDEMDTKVFQAPNDEGHAANPNYEDNWPDSRKSMILSKGTSYQGEFVWFNDSSAGVGLRFGAFMRPTSLMPDSSETCVYTEARFGQAYISSAEYVAGGAFGGTPVDVEGWYGKIGEFAVGFADGHAAKVKIRKEGTMYPISGFDPVRYQYRNVMARGPGWRVDCFPAPWIEERSIGNP